MLVIVLVVPIVTAIIVIIVTVVIVVVVPWWCWAGHAFLAGDWLRVRPRFCVSGLVTRLVPRRITVDGANLTVSNVTAEDAGVYACSAQTALDSVTEETQVTVLGECVSGPSPG